MSSLHYSVHQTVEVSTDSSGTWVRATVIKLDHNDTALPYFVRLPDGVEHWVEPTQIRALGPTGPRLQFRTRFGSAARGARYSEWRTLEPGMDVRLDGAWGMETREMPYRTDAEIVAALRDYTDKASAQGAVPDAKFAEILGGTF